MLFIDEFIYLISYERLIPFKKHRSILRKIYLEIEACHQDQSKCAELCKQFDLNKFSYLIDGETLIIKEFLKNYERFRD